MYKYKVYYDKNNYNKVFSIFENFKGNFIIENCEFIQSDDDNAYEKYLDKIELKVIGDQLTKWEEPLEVAKLRKKNEIEQNHLQANLRPMIWRAPLYDEEDQIVSFVFDVKRTDAMVCDPMEILNTTIQLEAYKPTKYTTKLVVNKQITSTKIAVSIDKNTAITMKSHLRLRTTNFIDLRTQYKQALEDATTLAEVNSINPIFNY
jgi:hypothetical protein